MAICLRRVRKMAKRKVNGGLKTPRTNFGVEGFYKVNIVDPDGTVKGDSGWHHNLIPNAGLTGYISKLFAQSAGSSVVGFMQLGSSQSAIASSGSSLVAEFNKSLMASIGATQITTRASSTSGDTVRFLATFISNSMFTTDGTIAGIGLYNITGANSIFAGGSFASSTLGANQAINCTYDVVFLASTS
jgi:hypothetical protein